MCNQSVNKYIQYFMLQLLITFIWFGATIPEDYMIKLGEITYPYQLLMNPFYNTKLKLDIQKSDRYRLEFLRHGGIYSDIDNNIHNYTCLMQKLGNFDGELAVSQINTDGANPNNNLIYVPLNRTELINQILDQNPEYHKLCDKNVVGCNGPALFYKYRHRITVLNLTECLTHDYDFSWWNDSNIVLNQTKSPTQRLKKKAIKKKFYIEKMNEYKIQKEELQKKLAQMQLKLNEAKNEQKKNPVIKEAITTTPTLQQSNENLPKETKNEVLVQFNRSVEILLKKFEELKKQNSVSKQQNNLFRQNIINELLSVQENKFSQQANVLEQILLHINVLGFFLTTMLITVFLYLRIILRRQKVRKEHTGGHQELIASDD